MTNFFAELVLSDLIKALERFTHQMELQRASIGEATARQKEIEDGIVQKQREFQLACADLARAQEKHEELQKEIKKWTKQLEGTDA